jgi:chemotaxis regulatin CheY-phosphate phosphatase CheZ
MSATVPGSNGHGGQPAPTLPAEPGDTGAAAGVAGGGGVSATDLLVDLAQCQRSIRSLLRAAISGMVPVSNQTLPGVVLTLSGLIHATEMAANKVLDHAEGLALDRERLGKALARLEPMLDLANPAARQAWLDVRESTQGLNGRVMAIMSAMAFQDLTTQQLLGAIQSVEQVRESLVEVLKLLDLPVEVDDEAEAIDRSRPAFQMQSRQAIADRLWNELRG